MYDIEDVRESLKHAIHVLTGILEDAKSENYTREQAALDVENLTTTEGLDFVSALTNYAGEEIK